MTSLVRWDPFSDLDIMERRMRRMLEDFGVAGGRLPTSDVLETRRSGSSSSMHRASTRRISRSRSPIKRSP